MDTRDLLTIAGICAQNFGDDNYYIINYGFATPDYLRALLGYSKTEYELKGYTLILKSIINEEMWLNAIRNATHGGVENDSFSAITAREVEPSVRGIVAQLNRLKLETVGSNEPHPNRDYSRLPSIAFRLETSAFIASKLFPPEKVTLPTPKFLELSMDFDELYGASVMLSRIPSSETIRSPIRSKRVELLKILLSIHGASGNEEKIREQVLKELQATKPIIKSVKIDKVGNILASTRHQLSRPNVPANRRNLIILLSAHLDIHHEFAENSSLDEKGRIIRRSEGILGGDDRAGVALIINVLREFGNIRRGCEIRIAFTVGEEHETHGAESIPSLFFEGVDYAISLDRQGCKDIVTHCGNLIYDNAGLGKRIAGYSTQTFDNPSHFFEEVDGGISDLRVWSQRFGIPSVNLSTGFFYEHTDNEYLNFDCWHRTHELLIETISRL